MVRRKKTNNSNVNERIKLTPRQERFAIEYVSNGGNATEAYIVAYEKDKNGQASRKSITERASRLKRHPGVVARIEEIRRLVLEKKVTKWSRDLAAKVLINIVALRKDSPLVQIRAISELNKMYGLSMQNVTVYTPEIVVEYEDEEEEG